MNLTKRERKTLLEIGEWESYSAPYSVFWTPKTNEQLRAFGLVTIEGAYVRLTDAGRQLIKEEQP